MKAVIAFVGLALLVSSASAYPWFFANSATCGKHPQQAFGPHLPPQPDPSTTIALTLVNTTTALAPSAPLCPGKKYQVKVQWDPNLFNHVLLTTSTGSWANLPIPGCNLSTYLMPAVTQIIDTLTVPCSATGEIQINVTHSQPGQAYLQASISKNVSAACAAASCPKPPSPPPKKASPPPKKASPPPPKKASPPPPKKASPPPKKASPPPPKKASSPPPKKASPPPPKKKAPPPAPTSGR